MAVDDENQDKNKWENAKMVWAERVEAVHKFRCLLEE